MGLTLQFSLVGHDFAMMMSSYLLYLYVNSQSKKKTVKNVHTDLLKLFHLPTGSTSHHDVLYTHVHKVDRKKPDSNNLPIY